MNERKQKHEEHNSSRQLTAEQRAAKQKKKLQEVAIFTVCADSDRAHCWLSVAVVPHRTRPCKCTLRCSAWAISPTRSDASRWLFSCSLLRLHAESGFFVWPSQVEMNAQQYNLRGVAVLHKDCNVVVVEGGPLFLVVNSWFMAVLLRRAGAGPKGIKKYKGLILRRINWDAKSTAAADDDAVKVPCLCDSLPSSSARCSSPCSFACRRRTAMTSPTRTRRPPGPPRPRWFGRCVHSSCPDASSDSLCVRLQGIVPKHQFRDFRCENARTEVLAKKFFTDKVRSARVPGSLLTPVVSPVQGLLHLWDMAKNYREATADL